MRTQAGTSVYAGFLLTVLGIVAWVSGQAFIFPSLGPSAFALAVDGRQRSIGARRLVSSHAIGAVAGLLAYSLFAADLSIATTHATFSPVGLQLAASAVFSVVATSWALLATETTHLPACATTLIVSLGLLSTPMQVGIIVVSVFVLAECHLISIGTIERVSARRTGS